MDNILQNLSAHPLAIIGVIFIGLLIVYFLFKRLLKLTLLFLMVLLAIGGYYYFQDPGKMPRNMMETLEKAKTGTEKAVEKGKEAYSKGRAIVEKGRHLAEGMDNLTVGNKKNADQAMPRDDRDRK